MMRGVINMIVNGYSYSTVKKRCAGLVAQKADVAFVFQLWHETVGRADKS